MKKVVDGKMYNTDTATELASIDNGYGYGDIYYVSETLYRKKTGEYFLFAEGGAYTKYGEAVGRNQCGGCHIILMTEEKAKHWVEKNCDGDTYISIFGDIEE